MATHPGITERRDAAGRVRFRVEVRRNGHRYSATLATLAEATAWRLLALDAADGRSEPPAARAEASTPAAPPIGSTVQVAARTLLRGMESGELRNKRGADYKPSAFRAYEASLRLHIVPRLGSMPVAALTRGDVQRWVDAVAVAATPDAARKALVALRVTIRVAERYGDELLRDPCAGITVPTTRKDKKRPTRRLERSEVAAIRTAAADDDQARGRSFAAPLVDLLLLAGLRLGETLALTYGDDGVDTNTRQIRVRHSVDPVRDRNGDRPLLDVKSDAGQRVIPMGAELTATLLRHRLATAPVDGALVFADRHGKPFGHTGQPRSTWRRVVEAARLAEPLPTPHDLRHAHASMQLARGATAHEIAQVLGHADAGLVNERYGHALSERIATSGDALEAFLRGE